MLNLTTISFASLGALLVTLSAATSNLTLARHSESGSLVVLGLGLLVVAFVARLAKDRRTEPSS
jgi:hypothetical protein